MLRFLWILIIAVITAPGWATNQLNLNDLKDWKIATAEDAIPAEKYAAQEFQQFIKQCAGFEMTISTKIVFGQKTVFIGQGSWLSDKKNEINLPVLGDEGLYIRINPDSIIITGGRPRGTLYGVYEFAEKYLGIRFLTFDHTYFPIKNKWIIPCEEHKYIPPFSFRWSYYKENSDYPEFAARQRINTTAPDKKLGGVTEQGLISHSLMAFLPVEKYGKDHPEYFALVDGKRLLEAGGGGPEPCVTNPEVIEIVANGVIAALDQNPNQKNISVSQNDNDLYCHCEKCEAINKREGTPMGSHLAFVNAVAERVEKKHPNVKIGTLAYWYTRKPPQTIKPRENVQIQLCSIECCTLHAIDDPKCEKNREFCHDMVEWGKICKDIWVWNYNTNFAFYDLPFPNLRSISKNVNYFLRNNTHGLFMQANGNSNTGEMCDLRNYVLSRCIWNPALDSWDVAEEFCRLHYGKSAKTIIEYLQFLHNLVEKTGCHPTCFPAPFEVGLNPRTTGKIFDYFTEALAKAENETVRNRVEKASLCSLRAVLETCGEFSVTNGTLRITYPEKFGDVAERYMALTKKYGETRAEEWENIDQYYTLLTKYTKTGLPAEQIENKTWKIILLPSQNGKVIEMEYKPAKRFVLGNPNYRCLRKFFDYMTMTEKSVEGELLNTPPEFSSKNTGSEIVLTKTLSNGSAYIRKIQLREEDPTQVFFAATITHQGNEPQVYQMKAQAQFCSDQTIAASRNIHAYYKDKDWECITTDSMQNNEITKEFPNLSGGQALFFNSDKRFGIIETFSPATIEKAAFHRDKNYPLAELNLQTKKVELKKGEQFELSYRVGFITKLPRK